MEKVIIVGVNANIPNETFTNEMEELKNLCEACELEVIDIITQNLDIFNSQTYVGKGKLEEIKMVLESEEIDTIVFNDELRPMQISNIQKYLNINIYDRTYIILEIFKRRAQTKEAYLQVEIAYLKYELPRLAGTYTNLSRQRGVANVARGRGIGETKLELDRRIIHDRIAFLNNELKELTLLRQTQRVRRKKNQMKIVSLVGYTNSGKSSILNNLLNYSKSIKKEVFQKDMLFATLETSTRLIKTNTNMQFLITDTVGFISKLPHQLIEAFKATLEEITESDLIIHVVDSANPNFEQQIEITNKVLTEIGVKDIPVIYAFNKIDLHNDYFYIPPAYSDAIRISATNNINFENFLSLIEETIFSSYHFVNLSIPYSKVDLIHPIKEQAIIIKFDEKEDHYAIQAKVSDHLYEILKEYTI